MFDEWLIGWLIGWTVGWLVVCLSVCLFGWLFVGYWLDGCLVGRLVGWFDCLFINFLSGPCCFQLHDYQSRVTLMAVQCGVRLSETAKHG